MQNLGQFKKLERGGGDLIFEFCMFYLNFVDHELSQILFRLRQNHSNQVYNSHLIDFFIIAIVGAMKLICEGYKIFRGRKPVSTDLKRCFFSRL